MCSTKTREVSKLHGDGLERESAARVHEALQKDVVKSLEAQVAALKTALQAKDRELRGELREKHALVKKLQTLVIESHDLERMRFEISEYKKAGFQLVGALTHTMEAQVEVLSTSEVDRTSVKSSLEIYSSPSTSPRMLRFTTRSSTWKRRLLPQLTVSKMKALTLCWVTRHQQIVILMQWVNSLVARQPQDWLGAQRMQNFHSSLNDGKVHAVVTKLLHAAMCRTRLRRPPGATVSRLEATSVLRENGEDLTEIAVERYLEYVRRETSVEKRLELMINTLGQAMWLPLGAVNGVPRARREHDACRLAERHTSIGPERMYVQQCSVHAFVAYR